MRILLSNDDGVHAPGLKVLYESLKNLGKVVVVAPLEEKSTTGHSLTIHKPLRLHHMENGFYAVSGSPADCVYLGVREVLKGKPDFVVSGINRGANLGQDVYYSGTVSAAREACIMGIPSFAVSLSVNFNKPPAEKKIHYSTAGKATAQLIKKLKRIGVPEHTVININVPDLPFSKIKGVMSARQGFRYYSGTVLKRRDHRGKDYFWVGGQYKGFHRERGTDCYAVEEGYVSVTPIRLDTTHYDFLATLEESGL